MPPIVTFLIFWAIDFVPTALYAVGRVSVRNGVDYCMDPPSEKWGGDVFFVQICIFELSLGPYFLSDFGFSHIKIITATYPTQSFALPPFWVSPLFCTNLQNRWIYFSDWMDSCILIWCGGRIWRVISDPTKFYKNTPCCVYVIVVWWAQRNVKYPKSWPENGAKKETNKLDINGVKIYFAHMDLYTWNYYFIVLFCP